MATTVPAPADNPRPDTTPDAALTHFRLGIAAGEHLAAFRARLNERVDQFTAQAVAAALTTGQGAR